MPAGVAAVVPTVRVEVAVDVPVTVAEGAKQVNPAGVPLTVQAKFTWPVKPPEGVTVNMLVPSLPAVTVMEPPFVSPNAGAALIVIGTLVVDVILPVAASVAVTVAV